MVIIMKTKIIASLLFLSGLFFTGCDKDYLDIKPPSGITPDSYFLNADHAIAAINAAYATLQSSNLYNEDYPAVIQAPTDDANLYNTWGTSLNNWSITAAEAAGGRLDDVWQGLYEGVFRSNMVIQEVPDIEMDESLKTRILGEARFLRALYYWHLTSLFGEVPLITEADPNNSSKAAVAKSPVSEIYDLMIGDLQIASATLPLRSEYDLTQEGRATKGAAQALLGKVYLYDENFPLAEAYLDSVISSGEYQLIEDFSALWVVDNTAESIFEIQYDPGTRTGEGPNRPGFNLPNGHGGNSGNIMPIQDAVDAFEEYTGPSAINGRDPRLFYTIWRDGEYYDEIDPVYDANWTPTGYLMKKGLSPVQRIAADRASNIVLIRLADVLLMYAEAANENGKQDDAINAINKVRNRVGMPELPLSLNQQEVFEAIVHERRVELMFEYHRLNDLRRWGLAEEQLSKFGYVAPKNRYFPIPQEELYTNPQLEQNPHY